MKHKNLFMSAAILVSVVSFLYVAPLWAGRVNEKKNTKMRQRSVEYWPQVSSPLV